MTIIVGVLCEDGVVIGADSAATFVAGQMKTIKQPINKIDIVESRVIIAGSGAVGLNQRFVEAVDKLSKTREINNEKTPVEIGKLLSKTGIDDFVSTNAPKSQYGALVAFPNMAKGHLCELGITDFQPELKNEDLWFVSIGSGQPIVDPFLALMGNIFWPESRPSTCEDGVILVYWALQHAIEVNPGGINKPIKIAVLQEGKKPNDIKARILSAEELIESDEMISEAKEHIREWRNARFGAEEAVETPKK